LKNVGGVWLPDHEVHLVEWMQKRNEVVDGRLTYQYHKLTAALAHVKQFRVAVDVGAHCGLWSMHLVKRFQLVHAFEPVAAHRECFGQNVITCQREEGDCNACEYPRGPCERGHVFLYPCALGEQPGRVSMNSAATSSGDTLVAEGDDVEMRTLDSFYLQEVDFIKLDCEGYELFALNGGEETLKRCRPCVIVEQKPGKAQQFGLGETDAVAYLQGLGARLRQVIAGDYILSWD